MSVPTSAAPFRTVLDFKRKKLRGEKISMVTCYDASFAQLIALSPIDTVLVGDSVAMTVYGRPNTLGATVDEMVRHVEAVVRGAPGKFVVADLPFLSYRASLEAAVDAVRRLLVAGAQAVKLEGGEENAELIRHLSKSGIPVIGHLGLTPQHIHQLGGFRVQGREESAQEMILSAAKELEASGCVAVVLECIPLELARELTSSLEIPTIGIGAGPHVDGQVLVLYDLLGLSTAFSPKFLKRFLNGGELVAGALEQFHTDVCSSAFPALEHSYE